MSLFVYATALDYESGGKLLLQIRQKVSQLKSSHPKLRHCSLADVSVEKREATVNVTLFFQS